MVRIAAAAYPLDWFEDWSQYEAKLTRWVAQAAGQGAQLLVFPEYGAMELASLSGAEAARDPEAAARAVDAQMPQAWALHEELARRYAVHILSASGPVWDEGAPRPVNRAGFFGPEGAIGTQDKQIMVPYERDEWDIVPGGPLHLFETALGRIGVLICYDCEFPLLARALVDAGAEILLVPSATETVAGFTRVRVGAMARALENQCVAVHSPTVGAVPWCPPVDANHGRAAIYGPPDRGWPETGILAQTELDAPGWAIADIAAGAIAEVRRAGGVRTHQHWAEQPERLSRPVRRVPVV